MSPQESKFNPPAGVTDFSIAEEVWVYRVAIVDLTGESKSRWLWSARRFWTAIDSGQRQVHRAYSPASDRIPSASTSSTAVPPILVESIEPSEVPAWLRFQRGGTLVWAVTSRCLKQAAQMIVQASVSSSRVLQTRDLQVVAADRLNSAEKLGLAELGIVAFLETPEQFARFTPVVHRHATL